MSYLQNKFTIILEKVVMYLSTIYDNDIDYQTEYIEPAFNYKYINRKIMFLDRFENTPEKIKIIEIINSELPNRMFDDYYDNMLEELEDYYGLDQEDYFEEYEKTDDEMNDEDYDEDERKIDFNFRYNVNAINYLELFIIDDDKYKIKEYINNMLDNFNNVVLK